MDNDPCHRGRVGPDDMDVRLCCPRWAHLVLAEVQACVACMQVTLFYLPFAFGSSLLCVVDLQHDQASSSFCFPTPGQVSHGPVHLLRLDLLNCCCRVLHC